MILSSEHEKKMAFLNSASSVACTKHIQDATSKDSQTSERHIRAEASQESYSQLRAERKGIIIVISGLATVPCCSEKFYTHAQKEALNYPTG